MYVAPHIHDMLAYGVVPVLRAVHFDYYDIFLSLSGPGPVGRRLDVDSIQRPRERVGGQPWLGQAIGPSEGVEGQLPPRGGHDSACISGQGRRVICNVE